MIIDFHTHVFPDKIASKARQSLLEACHYAYKPVTDCTANGLKEFMKTSGVDISVVLPVVTKRSQTESTNLWAKSICDKNLIAFGGIFPDETYKEQVDFVCSLGLKGIKLHAQYQNFVVDDPKMLKIYDYCFQKDLIIVHHAGADPAYEPPFNSSPKQFANILKQLRGGKMVAAHFGGHAQWQEVEDHLCGKDIYLDTSMGFEYYGKERFLKIAKSHGTDKILFATDSPWSNATTEIEHLKSMPLIEAEKEQIFCKNAQKLLNI